MNIQSSIIKLIIVCLGRHLMILNAKLWTTNKYFNLDKPFINWILEWDHMVLSDTLYFIPSFGLINM